MPTQTRIRAFVYKVVLGAGSSGNAQLAAPGSCWESIRSLWTATANKQRGLGALQTGNNLQGRPAVPLTTQMSCNPNNSDTAQVSATIANSLKVNNKCDSSKLKKPVRMRPDLHKQVAAKVKAVPI